MGEYKFSVNSSLSSIEYQSSVNTSGLPSSSSSQSYFADDSPQQLQDVAVKQQISPSPVNGDHQQLPSTKGAVKEDSVLAALGSGGDKSSGGPQMQLPSSYNNEASLNVINSSTNSSTSSLWSASVDDTLIHGLNASAAANNANFPNTLYNTGLGPHHQQQQPQQHHHRRQASGATHNFPHNLSRQLQQSAHPQNLYMASKGYSWSQSHQNSWLNSSQNQSGIAGSSWNRGRSVPNLNPMHALAGRKPNTNYNHHQHQSTPMNSSKFRRSTSYPGKGLFNQNSTTFDINNIDETDVMSYQERCGNGTGPLDNMRNLEHYLNDIMRSGTENPEHVKGFINSNTLHSLAHIHSKSPFFQTLEDQTGLLDDPGSHLIDTSVQALTSPSRSSPHSQGSESSERFSRKVFVGGLPPDIDEDEITASFRRFGQLVVDWPHKAESKSYFPPKGYAFLLFQDESSVQQLIDACIQDDDKLYLCVSSPTIKDKPVQIRPWRLSDADFVLDASMPLDPRKTVFVGGVPRPLKAVELAMIMDRLYGGVCYAGIDTDPELKYPKGAGRVAFSNQQSYIAAISARFVQLQHGDIDKRVEVKPYVLDDQMCDECQGQRCGGKFAPFFCANVTCLQYYCELCWATIHSRPGREFHKPLVKEGAERPRTVPFRWS
ncbi:cytoplasmic polyadenylation element-binding protein 2 isoform X1 [Acyrthosiphon pisum]|uniref:RRM domain-containing protein n=1 Tax=Acyrthosiphon pisum TaxID=7029 RepID=A0A8R2NLJ2_ACYPI|nr:cytoplasmic polyadenylation element-binding protein 2 isoform X1 [Acyrthosiphon pisum]